MKRFKITVPYGTMFLYYNSIEDARKSWKEATSIEEVEKDEESKKLCETIRKMASNIVIMQGRETWVLPSPVGEIYFHPFKDENGEFLEACEYSVESFGLLIPVTRNLISVKKFWELFQNELTRKQPYLLDVLELKKIKAKKYGGDIDGFRFYIDGDKNLYITNKKAMPTKRQVSDYKKRGGTDAVYVKYGTVYNYEYKWFDSFEEFKVFFEKLRSESNPSYADPTYTVIKKGTDLKNPNERKCYAYLGKPPIFQDTRERNARSWAASLRGVVSDWRCLIPTLEKVL